jgi:hypothetical protein
MYIYLGDEYIKRCLTNSKKNIETFRDSDIKVNDMSKDNDERCSSRSWYQNASDINGSSSPIGCNVFEEADDQNNNNENHKRTRYDSPELPQFSNQGTSSSAPQVTPLTASSSNSRFTDSHSSNLVRPTASMVHNELCTAPVTTVNSNTHSHNTTTNNWGGK